MNSRKIACETTVAEKLRPSSRLRDYETMAHRVAPLPTSGAYKLMSILPLFYQENIYRAAAFADGTGGFTRVLALLPDTNFVVYNTLVTTQDYVTQMDPIQNIPDIADLPEGYQDKVHGLREVNDFPSDITHPGYPEFFVSKFG